MDKFVKKIKEKEVLFAAGGAEENVVARMEKELALRFANDYRNYLHEYGQVVVDAHELTGSHKSPRLNVVNVTEKYREKYENIPNNWYVVEDLGIDGILIWQSGDGTVYETNAAGVPNKIADSLVEYFDD